VERKHQFAIWYMFAAFLGVMLVQFLWLRVTQVDTIPHSQFEQPREQDCGIASRTGDPPGILKQRFPDGRKMFYTVRVEPELADKLRAHSAVITGAPSSMTYWRSPPFAWLVSETNALAAAMSDKPSAGD